MEDTLRTGIAIIVLAMAPINLFVTYKLLSLSHSYNGEIGALSERASVSGLLSIASVLFSIIASAVLIEDWTMPTWLYLILIGSIAILIGLPAIWWMAKYYRGGFGEEDKD